MLSMKKYKIARKYWSVKSVGYFCESTGLYGCFANFLKTRIKINFSLKYESEAGDSVGQMWPTASNSLPPASLNQSHDSLFTVSSSSSVASITFIGNMPPVPILHDYPFFRFLLHPVIEIKKLKISFQLGSNSIHTIRISAVNYHS